MRGDRIRSLLLIGVLAALLLGVVASAPGGDGPPAQASARPPAHTVTLITGDRVRVLGGHATIVDRAPGTTAYSVVRDRAALYVIPDQALPLIAAHTLDRRLFDVTGLIRQGYDDASTDTLPVIVESGGRRLAAASATRSLPAIDATAVDVAKAGMPAFWRDVTARRLAPQRVWLDAQVRSSLDRSVLQIGAPAAWSRGLDGRGVSVAVLDSGIDASHPDLAGQVAAAANFTTEPDTDDHVGHGTHVASIVAGTGARYRGVATGARLLNGKVLELAYTGPGLPTGVGRESWIVAGMQWAVARDADVVNMSLGNGFPDGNDPVSRAADALTAASGTLFVVAAGNVGPDHYTIGGPGTADRALTVGSVGRDGAISSFSSRGPRLIDGAVKPDVTAPGEGIVAARAADGKIGTPVDDRYVGMTGTSMATPHVAGAAALVLQQHPGWDADELRAALTSTATFDPAQSVYEQGGGLIDLDRATRQDVLADSGTLSLGYFEAGEPQHASRTVTYRNTGEAPVTLELAAELEHQSGEPAGGLTVSPRSLTVPAHGSATASLTVDVSAARPGAYSGRVVASGPGVQLQTPLGFSKQGAETQLTLRAIDRRGKPAPAFLIIRSPRFPGSFLAVAVPEGGSSTVRLDPGDYSYLGYVPTADERGRDGQLTVVADPELEASQPNRTLTLDARRAQPLDVRVPRDVDVNGLTAGLQVERPELGDFRIEDTLLFARGASNGTLPALPMSVLPFERPRRGHGNLDSYWSLVSPRARAAAISPRRYPLPVRLMDGSARIDGSSRLQVADLGAGRPQDYEGRDVSGAAVLVRETDGLSFTDQAATAQEHGAAALLVSAALPGVFAGDAFADIPVLALEHDAGGRLRADLARRPVQIGIWGTSAAEYLYDLTFRERDRLRSSTIYRPHDLARVRVDYHAEGPQRFWGLRFPDFGEPCGYCAQVAREGEDFNGGRTRTDYLTAGVRWSDYLLQDGWLQWNATREYRRGSSQTSWGRAPVAPGVPIEAGRRSERVDDQLRIRLAGYTDGDPAHFVDLSGGWFRGTTELAHDGAPIGPCEGQYVLHCDVDVPTDRATYTLTADMPAPSFTKAVQSSTTTWTFASAPGERTLPLIDLDYDLPLSRSNTLPAGGWSRLLLDVRRQPGSPGGPIRSVRVQASFDDGGSWRGVPVLPLSSGRYLAFLRQPAQPGDGSLRVTATDAAGNRIEQEVIRAYGVEP